MRVILASSSPRRKMILTQAGVSFEVSVSDLEEKSTATEPQKVVEELSAQKAEDVASRYPKDVLVIGADTVVACSGKILGKPKDAKEAYEMIAMLSGKTHQVYTGVTLIANGQAHTFHAVTDVVVCEMSEAEIQAYASTPEPLDKAGAYAIQGAFAKYISKISGEYNNVVGLPVAAIFAECKRLGIPITE